MDANQILKSDLLDIIFEGRNKEYGAYELRRTYNRRITYALIGMVSLILIVFLGRVLAGQFNAKETEKELVVNETQLQELKPNEPPPPPPPTCPSHRDPAWSRCRSDRSPGNP